MKHHYPNCDLGDRCQCDAQDEFLNTFPVPSGITESAPVAMLPADHSTLSEGLRVEVAGRTFQCKFRELAVNLIIQTIRYNKDTGEIRKLNKHGEFIPVTFSKFGEYPKVSVCSLFQERAHIVAWVCANGSFPVGVIDHINRDKWDNRYENLRDTTVLINNLNRDTQANNKSGAPGVDWCKKKWQWRARIRVGKKAVFEKWYKDVNVAIFEINAARAEMLSRMTETNLHPKL